MFYSDLKQYRKALSSEKQPDALSFFEENNYLTAKIKPYLDEKAKIYIEKEIIEKKLLFGDWLCINTESDSNSTLEANFYLLVALIDSKLQDFATMKTKLEKILDQNLGKLRFSDLVFLLFTYSKYNTL